MNRLRVIVIVLFLFLSAGYAQGGSWYSPLTAVVGTTGLAVISVAPDDTTPEAMKVTADIPVGAADDRWILIGLPAGGQKNMKALEICYQITATTEALTYIDTVKLTKMTTPDTPSDLFEYTTDLNSADPVCQRLDTNPKKLSGAVTLKLKVVLGDAADSIKIGGIRLVF